MPADLVAARPERLQAFRATAGGLSDGLIERRAALRLAQDDYRVGTERAFEIDVSGALDAVAALADAIVDVGSWVGEVGDAFDVLPIGGVVGAPNTDWVGGVGDLVEGVLTNLRSRPGESMADSTSRAVGQAVRQGVVTASQLGAIVTAVRSGMAEISHRWQAEPDRPGFERGARAGLDGALNTGGILGGSAVGAAIATRACGGLPACGVVGGTFGGQIGQRVGEELGDLLLGDEPPSWARDPIALASDIAAVEGDVVAVVELDLEAVAADASAAASRHNNFVMEHPWVWADTYRDAPVHAPPPPAPDIPVAGAR